MNDGIAPISRTAAERRAGRRVTDPTVAPETAEAIEAAASNLPVPIAPPPVESVNGAFEAQLLGQQGQKRGLRGGQPVLEHARSAYLEAEYSGPADRRPPSGVIAKTTI